MNNDFDSSDMINFVPNINQERNYWLVRTSSGSNYEDFIKGGYIAIGWNEVTLFDLNSIKENPENVEHIQEIKSKIDSDSGDPEEEQSRGVIAYQSRSLNQLMKFTYEIKRGDIVVIPSYNSSALAFGEVLETPLFIASDLDLAMDTCPFRKRKKVKWFKINVDRNRLDANLYRFIFAHQTVNSINDYAEYINNYILDFYHMDGKYTLVLRLRKEGNLDAFAIDKFYSDLIAFAKEFAEFSGNEIGDDSLSVKFNLQSPGTIVFIGSAVIGVGLIAIGVLTNLAGGEWKFEFDLKNIKFGSQFKSGGFLKAFSQFLNEKQDRMERAKRLEADLNRFEVDKNRNLEGLIEPEKPGKQLEDKRIDRPEIQDGDNHGDNYGN